MAEYTWDDIIIDPTSERAKEAIGKECYFDDIPIDCLRNANCDYIDSYGKLIGINNEFKYPFSVGRSYHPCIIVKKEEPYAERAKKWIEENNLEVGDYVKVLRETEPFEKRWGGFWVDQMSDYIGKALKVLAINQLNGLISLECDDIGYNFPYFVLEKAEPPKPKYVPFESAEEFVRRYTEVKEGADFDTFEDNLFQCGMWLKCRNGYIEDDYIQITRINSSSIQDGSTWIDWGNVLRNYTFLDGTPCGKESKDE